MYITFIVQAYKGSAATVYGFYFYLLINLDPQYCLIFPLYFVWVFIYLMIMVGSIEIAFEVGVCPRDWLSCCSQKNRKMAACYGLEKVVVRIREFDPEKVEHLEL